MQNKLPIICGGYGSPTDCVVVGKDKIEPFVTFNLPRPASASVSVDENTIWVTGAEWGDGKGNSEYVVINENGVAEAIMGK